MNERLCLSFFYIIVLVMIKAILFDLDGTLIDSESYYMQAMKKIAKHFGSEIEEKEFHCVIGKTMEETYNTFEKLISRPREEWVKYYNDFFVITEPLDFKKLLFEDVLDTFKGLKQKGIKVAICSMSPVDYIKKFVDDCNLIDYVDYYVSGEECKHTKPYPDIYLKALNDLNITNDEAIVVEDADTGIDAAIAANIKVVARDDSKFGIDQSKAFAIFKDLRKLLTIL